MSLTGLQDEKASGFRLHAETGTLPEKSTDENPRGIPKTLGEFPKTPGQDRELYLEALRRHWRRVKVDETAAAVKEVGAQNFVLATDLGQTGNPSPAGGLQLFVTDLMKAGVSKDEVTKMGREVTGSLLMG
jgi:hypothetical protein